MISKYSNIEVDLDGERFDSKKEARRWRQLVILQRAGQISDLRRQVRYELIPYQRGKIRNERAVTYIADFVYTENGETVVEDCKGMRTDVYIIKRKLMKKILGIEVIET